MSARSSGRPGIKGSSPSDGSISSDNEDENKLDDDVAGVSANLNFGDRVICESPSLWTGD